MPTSLEWTDINELSSDKDYLRRSSLGITLCCNGSTATVAQNYCDLAVNAVTVKSVSSIAMPYLSSVGSCK